MQTTLPLIPKVSSVYNKLLQLAGAILLIIVVMNIFVTNLAQNKVALAEHFDYVGHQYLNQAASALQLNLSKKNRKKLQKQVELLSENEIVKDVRFYDKTGLLIASSKSSSDINDLYGLSHHKSNKSEKFVPFVQEVRTDELNGYLRITLEKAFITEKLEKNNQKVNELLRLMLLLAGVVGFLLTRGFNRFSRQGFRIPH
jgi:membrane protein